MCQGKWLCSTVTQGRRLIEPPPYGTALGIAVRKREKVETSQTLYTSAEKKGTLLLTAH